MQKSYLKAQEILLRHERLKNETQENENGQKIIKGREKRRFLIVNIFMHQ